MNVVLGQRHDGGQVRPVTADLLLLLPLNLAHVSHVSTSLSNGGHVCPDLPLSRRMRSYRSIMTFPTRIVNPPSLVEHDGRAVSSTDGHRPSRTRRWLRIGVQSHPHRWSSSREERAHPPLSNV